MSFPNNDNVGIQFSSYVKDIGWSGWIPEGLNSGNTGKGLQMEALKIKLTGINADDFDILYRVHTQSYGWSGWTKNGHPAGHEGYGKRIEAVEIRIAWAGEVPITDQATSFRRYTTPHVIYTTHVQSHGWLDIVQDGIESGTTGESKRLEGICISLTDKPFDGQISYQTHVQTYGWKPTVPDGALSGTTGEAKRLEAIKINLSGDMAVNFDVYYRTHVQTFGWTGWAKNGSPSGSEGFAKRLEAIQIVLVEKGAPAPGSIDKTFYK